MKKITIYMTALAFACGMAACSGDYEDASSRHSYGVNDNVYLNTSAGIWETQSLEFPIAQITEVKSISLADYAEDFKSELGMGVDEVISAVQSGDIDFKVISSSRGQWLADAMNNGLGWYLNASNRPCEQKDYTSAIVLNAGKKSLDMTVNPSLSAGTEFTVNVGFAKRDNAYGTYDNYVRFEIPVAVTDPNLVLATCDLEEGDYYGYEFFFENNYDEQFLSCMGMTAQEALNGLEDGSVRYYITDTEGNNVDAEYTADAGDGYYGYWLNGSGKICNWGDSDCAIYTDAELNECAIYFGRYPDYASKTDFSMKICVKLQSTSDASKFVRFIFTCNF